MSPDSNTCFFLCRTAESSSKETQKDVYCENGRNEEPLEEYRRALCQLVSVSLTRYVFGQLGSVSVCGRICKSRGKGKRELCACMCAQGEAVPVRHAISCSQDATVTCWLGAALINSPLCFCPSLFSPLSLFSSQEGSVLLSPPDPAFTLLLCVPDSLS